MSPDALLREIAKLEEKGVPVRERLRISPSCTLILPYHVALDQAREAARREGKIGTTGRGIGPAYEDKVARRGLRIGDLFNPERFAVKLKELMEYHNFVLQSILQGRAGGLRRRRSTRRWATPSAAADDRRRDRPPARVARAGASCIMFEGAQGSLLDIDHGTYPFVTCSNTTAGGTATGSGFGPLYLDYVLGITKAYTTRVGSGPFPTELFDDIGAHLASKGHEFGATTGRAAPLRLVRRGDRCVAPCEINSVSGLCLTKLDVLDGLETVKLCVAYKDASGEPLVDAPIDADRLRRPAAGVRGNARLERKHPRRPRASRNCRPMPAPTSSASKQLVGAPIDIISTGPDRDETIVLRHPYA